MTTPRRQSNRLKSKASRSDPLCPIGYAKRLKKYNNYGICGVDEVPDSEEEVDAKIKLLAQLIKDAPYAVSYYFNDQSMYLFHFKLLHLTSRLRIQERAFQRQQESLILEAKMEFGPVRRR